MSSGECGFDTLYHLVLGCVGELLKDLEDRCVDSMPSVEVIDDRIAKDLISGSSFPPCVWVH